MAKKNETLAPPSTFLLLAEGRAIGELLTSALILPALRQGPKGDGHPIMVLPGFLASGISTRFLRSFLRRIGYRPHCWRLGRNLGPADPELEERLVDRLHGLERRYRRKVSLIGWSLGGIYARMLANLEPDRVRTVITLGSPFNHDPKANHAWRLFEGLSGSDIEEVHADKVKLFRSTPPVPKTAIYSRTDGVTAWQCCVGEEGPRAENVRVPGSHVGLGFNPLVLRVLVDRLAQPEDDWQPFERSGVRRLLYPEPQAAEPADEPAEADSPAGEAPAVDGSPPCGPTVEPSQQGLEVGRGVAAVGSQLFERQVFCAPDDFSAVVAPTMATLEADQDPLGYAVVEGDLLPGFDIPHRDQIVGAVLIGLDAPTGITGMIRELEREVDPDVGVAVDLQGLQVLCGEVETGFPTITILPRAIGRAAKTLCPLAFVFCISRWDGETSLSAETILFAGRFGRGRFAVQKCSPMLSWCFEMVRAWHPHESARRDQRLI